MPEEMRRHNNLARKLGLIRAQISEVVKGLYHFKRTPATHVFVFMISSALREKKPYALLVQCVPYAGLEESDMRRMVGALVQEMHNQGMKVAGFVSNGEFNYLRSKGYTRRLSVLQIRTDVRNKYGRLREASLLDMLSPKVLPDGQIVAENPNPAVPRAILEEILSWKTQGATMEDIVERLRLRTVPPGFSPHPLTPGKSETVKDKLRSILAQLEYKYRIQQWKNKGIDFQTYLYVPEVHPVTQEVFCEREDEAHVLKRIANHTRSGGPRELNLLCFKEAYDDPTTGLIKAALTRERKQSVIDAEHFFGPNVADFMRRKGYHYELKYVETIWNWRRACDHRGLSELERCRFNYKFLNLILDDLMPWHKDLYDFSFLEVNRPIDNVLGFSRETLAAVICNIEGREWCRRSKHLRKPEHPRASTSDDVECFFSMMRDAIGRNFTTKQVQLGFRKVALEFMKRMDPDLPFYYHTSTHTRYSEGLLPDFSKASAKPKCKGKRVPRREISAAAFVRCATLPVHGSLSVRTQFHNQPIDLPPLPSSSIHVHEHSYANRPLT